MCIRDSLNAKHILESGYSKAGKVTIDHVKRTFGATEHANCDALVEPLRAIEEIITAMFEKHKFRPRNVDPLYTEENLHPRGDHQGGQGVSPSHAR